MSAEEKHGMALQIGAKNDIAGVSRNQKAVLWVIVDVRHFLNTGRDL